MRSIIASLALVAFVSHRRSLDGFSEGSPAFAVRRPDDRQRDLAGHSFGGAVPTMACGVARASGALRATSSSCAKAPVVPTPVQIIMSISNAITSNSPETAKHV